MFQLPLPSKNESKNQMYLQWKSKMPVYVKHCIYMYTCGIAQKRKIAGSFKSDMYLRQSSTCNKAFVTISFKHCTALTEFSSDFKSWEQYQWTELRHFQQLIHLKYTFSSQLDIWKCVFVFRGRQRCTSSLITYLLHISRGQNIRDFGISLISSR